VPCGIHYSRKGSAVVIVIVICVCESAAELILEFERVLYSLQFPWQQQQQQAAAGRAAAYISY
jgi:hypothetical protein